MIIGNGVDTMRPFPMTQQHHHALFRVPLAPSDDVLGKMILVGCIQITWSTMLASYSKASHPHSHLLPRGKPYHRFSTVPTDVWLIRFISRHGHLTRNAPQLERVQDRYMCVLMVASWKVFLAIDARGDDENRTRNTEIGMCFRRQRQSDGYGK